MLTTWFVICRQKTIQENNTLRSYLQSAQDRINYLLEEKQNLLEVIRNQQVSKVYNKII